jgi:hypothetical protein
MKPDSKEEQGIDAIIYLQKLHGNEETREQAREGWRAMNKREQVFTLEFYQQMKDKEK